MKNKKVAKPNEPKDYIT